ncbi:MAG TPA: hypothetical protein VNF47_10895 [Streptosporangiaceae bacterium]|nr:hypothetical protein [Streptosporangiaceae bacterium]
MSFSQHLVLWLHVAFVAFTIGPVTLAIMSTPRYIRLRDVRIVRYLARITFIFTLASLGVLIAGMALASMISKAGKWWVIVSATLFLVAVLLLVLIVRDQRKAIKALGEAAAIEAAGNTAAGLADEQPAVTAPPDGTATDAATGQAPGSGSQGQAPGSQGQAPGQAPAGTHANPIASVERGRIALTGGVVSLIWLVILVLMVWNS